MKYGYPGYSVPIIGRKMQEYLLCFVHHLDLTNIHCGKKKKKKKKTAFPLSNNVSKPNSQVCSAPLKKKNFQ
jgi:hypothetical protein